LGPIGLGDGSTAHFGDVQGLKVRGQTRMMPSPYLATWISCVRRPRARRRLRDQQAIERIGMIRRAGLSPPFISGLQPGTRNVLMNASSAGERRRPLTMSTSTSRQTLSTERGGANAQGDDDAHACSRHMLELTFLMAAMNNFWLSLVRKLIPPESSPDGRSMRSIERASARAPIGTR
jgi:hypothetical protein